MYYQSDVSFIVSANAKYLRKQGMHEADPIHRKTRTKMNTEPQASTAPDLSNTVLAEHLSFQCCQVIGLFMGWNIDEIKMYLIGRNGHMGKLAFNESWDYLMPVIEKIESLPTDKVKGEEYQFSITGYKEVGWAKTMVKRITTTSVDFIKNRIDETIDNETGNKDYFYSNHQLEFDKTNTGIQKNQSTQVAKKPTGKTLEELRNS